MVGSALLLFAGCLSISTLAVAPQALAASSAATSTATPATTPPSAPAGWTTVFSDNFAGPAGSAPSQQNWFYDIGSGYGNNEVAQTTNSTSNVYLDGNGHLVIQANDNNGTWTSGQIETTRDDFAAPSGGELEMTASIEQPNVANPLGYWPAFWAEGAPLRTTGTWPQSGEIDMLEDVNGLNLAAQNLHYGSGSQTGPNVVSCPNTGSTCQTGYHTYSVIINRTNTRAETLQFYIDSTLIQTITESEVGTSAWQAAVDHGFFIILNLAIGGAWPNGECNCTTPTSTTTSGGSMSVAYVAVYESKGNTTPTGTASATGTVNGPSSECLDNANSLDAEWNQIGMTTCDGSAGEQWSPYTDGTVRTQGGCLTGFAATRTSSAAVDWYPCVAISQQQWVHESNGELYNTLARACLTAEATSGPAWVTLANCTGSTAQKWTWP